MFVDASAVVAILGGEEDSAILVARLERATQVLVSPLSIYETVAGLARKRACPLVEAEAMVMTFIEETRARTVSIDATVGSLALAIFGQYGKGRHRADLNMGDCFAYACARHHGVALLFKGDDFIHTDIERA